jgi:hypothetical protein
MKLPLPLGMGPTWNTLGMRNVFVAANREHMCEHRDQHAAAETRIARRIDMHQLLLADPAI